MPLPLIVPIAVGVAGLFGAGKTVKAVINSKEADKLNDAASYIINNSKDSLELAKGVCSNNLEKLGFKKSYVLNDTVIKFIASFEKLKNVNFQSSVGMDELNKFITDEAKFKEIKEMSILASSIIQGVISRRIGRNCRYYGTWNIGDCTFAFCDRIDFGFKG